MVTSRVGLFQYPGAKRSRHSYMFSLVVLHMCLFSMYYVCSLAYMDTFLRQDWRGAKMGIHHLIYARFEVTGSCG